MGTNFYILSGLHLEEYMKAFGALGNGEKSQQSWLVVLVIQVTQHLYNRANILWEISVVSYSLFWRSHILNSGQCENACYFYAYNTILHPWSSNVVHSIGFLMKINIMAVKWLERPLLFFNSRAIWCKKKLLQMSLCYQYRISNVHFWLLLHFCIHNYFHIKLAVPWTIENSVYQVLLLTQCVHLKTRKHTYPNKLYPTCVQIKNLFHKLLYLAEEYTLLGISRVISLCISGQSYIVPHNFVINHIKWDIQLLHSLKYY